MTTNMINTADRTEPLSLFDLAGAINREHVAAEAAAKTALGHALNAGRLLLQVKAQLPHGAFLPWLQANCRVKQRQARNYMKLANGWPTLDLKTAPGADLTLKGALRLLDERLSETPTAKTGDAHIRINGTFDLPDELRPDEKLTLSTSDDMFLEIIPCRQSGYVYVAVYHDLDTDNADVEYTRRGIAAYVVGFALRAFGVNPDALLGGWHRDAFDGELPWYVKADATSVPGRCRRYADTNGRDHG